MTGVRRNNVRFDAHLLFTFRLGLTRLATVGHPFPPSRYDPHRRFPNRGPSNPRSPRTRLQIPTVAVVHTGEFSGPEPKTQN